MKRHLKDDELVALVFSDLSHEKETACRKHIDSCERCRAELESLRHAVSMLQEAPIANPPPFAWSRLHARIQKSGTSRDWTEPSWLFLILGHAGGMLLIMMVILLMGSWLETAFLWKSLRLWALARSFGPHGFVALVLFAIGALLTLAMTPVFWWESQRVPQHLRDGIH
jgi:anti-sigma factor RsiW